MSNIVRGKREDLEAERNFLLDSITDLDREHAAGDIDDADYESLRSDYVHRAAASLRVIEAFDASEADDSPRSLEASPWQRTRHYLGRPRVRKVLGVGSVVCLLAGIGLYAAHVAGVRLPGQSATGSVTLSQAAVIAQDLSEAALEANAGQTQSAVALYDAVLARLPDQQVALTYGGWLTRLSGLDTHDAKAVRAGDLEIAKSARLHPSYADGEGLDGVALFDDDHDVTASAAAFSQFAKDKPSHDLVTAVAPVAKTVFSRVGESLPKVFATA